VGLEHLDYLFHDEGYVEKGLRLGLGVKDVEDVVEGGIQLEIVELWFGVGGFGLLDES
jgi:hypothetical protein